MTTPTFPELILALALLVWVYVFWDFHRTEGRWSLDTDDVIILILLAFFYQFR